MKKVNSTKIFALVLSLFLALSVFSPVSAMGRGVIFSGGTGTENDPFIIGDIVDLRDLSNYSNGGENLYGYTQEYMNTAYYRMVADIDISIIKNWEPIGNYATYENRFQGKFDGENHRIEGLSINNPNRDYQGLFGYVEGATIQSVILDNTDKGTGVVGGAYVGTIAGYASYNSIIDNCSSMVDVRGTNSVGGLLGRAHEVDIMWCQTYGNVTGITAVGGLVGSVSSGRNEIMEICWVYGNITAEDSAGGLIGSYWADKYGALEIRYTYVHTESILRSSGTGTNFGSLVGLAEYDRALFSYRDNFRNANMIFSDGVVDNNIGEPIWF